MAHGLLLVASIVALAGMPEKAPAPYCLKALRAIEMNAAPQSECFEAIACPINEHGTTFRHSMATNYSQASRAIAAGEIVAPYPEFGTNMVRPGQELHIYVIANGVRIDRSVKAVQAAKAGQKLFVLGSDGRMLSARYETAP